jgi:hypothetical protein
MHNATSYECTTQPHMKQNRRSFLKSSATATSATVFAGLINTPGVANANTTAPGTTQPGTTQPTTTATPLYFVDCMPGAGYSQNPPSPDVAVGTTELAQNFPVKGKVKIWTTQGGPTGTAALAIEAWQIYDQAVMNTAAASISLSCNQQTGQRTAASAPASGAISDFLRLSQWYDNAAKLRYLDLVLTGTVLVTDNGGSAISVVVNATVQMIERYQMPIVGWQHLVRSSVNLSGSAALEIRAVA